jgi:hypothetical protein
MSVASKNALPTYYLRACVPVGAYLPPTTAAADSARKEQTRQERQETSAPPNPLHALTVPHARCDATRHSHDTPGTTLPPTYTSMRIAYSNLRACNTCSIQGAAATDHETRGSSRAEPMTSSNVSRIQRDNSVRIGPSLVAVPTYDPYLLAGLKYIL